MLLLWGIWKKEPPSDSIARSILKVELNFSDYAANEFLGVYRENITYVRDSASDKVLPENDDLGNVEDQSTQSSPTVIKVGDYVQWTSQGVDQFKAPQQVNRVEQGYAFVHGSSAGVPMAELAVVDPPKPPPITPKSASDAYVGGDGQLNVLLRGNRLEITADVGRGGLQRLKQILGKYEEILDLLDPPVTKN
jgi:hypothetical protein